MDENNLAKKLQQMDVMFLQYLNDSKLKGQELIRAKNDHAAKKFNFLMQHNIIKKDGWWPET